MNCGGRWRMKSIFRRITDALGLTRPTTTFIEEFSFDFNKSNHHVELTNKQILLLEQMIDNYNQQNIAICKCDVERVLDSCDLMNEELSVEG